MIWVTKKWKLLTGCWLEQQRLATVAPICIKGNLSLTKSFFFKIILWEQKHGYFVAPILQMRKPKHILSNSWAETWSWVLLTPNSGLFSLLPNVNAENNYVNSLHGVYRVFMLCLLNNIARNVFCLQAHAGHLLLWYFFFFFNSNQVCLWNCVNEIFK